MKKNTLCAMSSLYLAIISCSASAAGFQLWEQNASGLGVAYAGSAAIADDAAIVFFNPAGMTQLSGIQISAGVAGIRPSYSFRNSGTSGATGSDGGDAGAWAAVPNAYLTWQASPRLSLGLGLSSPFGLSTEYDSGWIGRDQTIKSEIKTVNINPSLAYRITDTISLGLGVSYQSIDAELTNSLSRLQGDDAAWGWNVGALFTPSPAMRIGLSYRSTINYTLEGTANDSVPVRADVELPDTFILSVWQQVSDRWEAMGDLSYTRWGSLKRLDVVSRNSGGLLLTENFNYDNAWRLAWGAAYRVNPVFKLKFGIAYDRTPVSDGDRSARVPDNDRLWFSLGGQWSMGQYGRVDIGYAYLFVKDPSINQTRNGVTLRGDYDANAHLLGVQYSARF